MNRVLLDQGLAPNAASLLRPGTAWDAIHVCEVGMSSANDEEILRFARQRPVGRTVGGSREDRGPRFDSASRSHKAGLGRLCRGFGNRRRDAPVLCLSALNRLRNRHQVPWRTTPGLHPDYTGSVHRERDVRDLALKLSVALRRPVKLPLVILDGQSKEAEGSPASERLSCRLNRDLR